MTDLSVIDLFCGAGGFTWGWHRSGFRTVGAVDDNTAAARTHELNFGSKGCKTLNADLTTMGPDQLAEILDLQAADPFIISGGPPCQGWSKVGRGKLRSLKDRAHSLLDDPRNSLYRQFVNYVTYFKPSVVVMENVPGMLSLEGRNVAKEVAENFADAGYTTSFGLVNALWFGVPQDRKRLIFIGIRVNHSEVPINVSDMESFGPQFRFNIANLTKDDTTLARAIRDLPEASHGTSADPIPYIRGAGRISKYAEFMRSRSNGLVTDHVCRWHNEQDLEAFSWMDEGGKYYELPDRLKRYRDDIFKDKYKKLQWDTPAWTVTAHLAKDCYTHIHPDQSRTISIREAARIQSFPDDFRFWGNMGDRFRQIGNAVPPLMAWGIAEFIKERLDLDSTSTRI